MHKTLLAYFLLTFVITWSVWLAAASLAAPGNTGFFGIRGPVFLLGVFAPALVALSLTARAEGRVGVERLLARMGHWRVGARWYVFAVGCRGRCGDALRVWRLTGGLADRRIVVGGGRSPPGPHAPGERLRSAAGAHDWGSGVHGWRTAIARCIAVSDCDGE